MNWNDVIIDFAALDLVVIVAAVIAAGASIISDIRNRRFNRRYLGHCIYQGNNHNEEITYDNDR